jgi:hypothetical protein
MGAFSLATSRIGNSPAQSVELAAASRCLFGGLPKIGRIGYETPNLASSALSRRPIPTLPAQIPFTTIFNFLSLIPNHFPLPPANSHQPPCYV